MAKIMAFLFLTLISLNANDSFYALKGGMLWHAKGLLSTGKEEGSDLHAELLFKPELLEGHLAVGADISLNGKTSFLYSGLAWERIFLKHLLLGVFFGLAVHNGELNNRNSHARQLGTRVLFREAVDVGFYLEDSFAISLLYDHHSNANLGGENNEGNDNLGIRFSYYF